MVKDDIKTMSKQLYIHRLLTEMKTDNTAKKQRVKKILLEGEAIDNISELDIDDKIDELLEG
jgi:Arc/MetJ-type ribon-helix-helix transcriptional regulator